MTWQQELGSWFAPKHESVSTPPAVGSSAPTNEKLQLPSQDHQSTVVTFLRHCGCPFAEKTFLRMRDAAQKNPNVHFVAVSHSNEDSTDKWLEAVGGQDKVEVIVDAKSQLYTLWGLGVASLGHIFNIEAFKSLYHLGSVEKITNRPTESGSRWQTSGTWATDEQGTITWGGQANSAHDIPDFEQAVASLSRSGASKL